MHQVHTLNPGCTHSPSALHPRSVHTASCRGLWPAVLWLCGRPGRSCRSARQVVSQRTLNRVERCVAHVVSPRPLRVLLRISQLPMPYRGVSPSSVDLVLRHNPAAKPRVYHDTPICITTQSPNSQALVRAPLALAGGPAVSQAMLAVSWRRLGRILVESRPCRGPQAAPRPHLPSLVSRYNPLYRDSNGQ